MDTEYKVRLSLTDSIPWKYMGAGNIYKGTIAFGPDTLTLATRYQSATISYTDLDYYTRSAVDLFLVHHNTNYPKVIMVAGAWPFLWSGKIKLVEQAMQNHGVKFSEESSVQAKKGATKALLVSTVIAVTIVAALLIVAAIVKKK